MKGRSRSTVLAVATLLFAMAAITGAAVAADAPKWVAAIFVEQQKSVGLRWLPVPGATGYKVLRSTTAGSGYAEIAAPAQPQHFDATVEAGSTYYYVLQSVAGAEVSPNSAEKSVVIPGVKKLAIAPPEWAKVQADSTTEFGAVTYRVGLTWNKPRTGTPIAYNLYRSEVAGKDYQMLTSLPENQYIDVKVEAGKTYYYVLTALDETFQESPYSAEQKVAIQEAKKEEVKKKKKKVTLVPLHTKPAFVLDNKQQLLLQPRDLVVDADGNVYVTDSVAKKIVVFNKAGEFVKRLGESGRGPGKLDSPSGIAIGPDGDLYVADQTSSLLHIFSLDGKHKKSIELHQEKNRPAPFPFGINFDPKGRIWISDMKNGQIHVYDGDGTFEFLFGNKYTEAGELIPPEELQGPLLSTFTNEGYYVTVDSAAHVSTYDQEGKLLARFGERGASVGAFMYPIAVALEPKNNWVFVVDKTVNTIQVFDPMGNFKYALSDPEGKGQMGVANPNGIRIVGKQIYVVENLGQRYSVYDILWEKSPPPYKED